MSGEAAVAIPALSSHQDADTFAFDQVKACENSKAHLNLRDPRNPDEVLCAIRDYYSLNELASFLLLLVIDDLGCLRKLYRRITLQFPDKLVCDSATIVHELQQLLGLTNHNSTPLGRNQHQSSCVEKCMSGECTLVCSPESSVEEEHSQRLWILADTSYSPCCVDEVAALHVKSDFVVHFGDACLNVIDSLPSAYVFGKPHVDVAAASAKFRELFPLEDHASSRIMLMADAPHTQILSELYDELRGDYAKLSYADLALPSSNKSTLIGYRPTTLPGVKALNRNMYHVLPLSLAECEEDAVNSDTLLLSNYHLFHLTEPDTPRLLQLTTKFSSVTIYHPSENRILQGPYPNLMRRYRYMHTARTAGTIGLLVNTLSLANTKLLINSITKKIKAAGKKHHIFVVGKPNVAKLANFESVDLWCILGCDHQGIVVDQYNEYFRPIVTPYELLLALEDDMTWTGKWETDFNLLLEIMGEDDRNLEESEPHNGSNENDGKNDNDRDSEEDAPPEFDSVTGRYVSTSRPLRRIQHLSIALADESTSDENNVLVKKFAGTVSVRNTVSTAAAHLQNRHWTGLGSDYDKEENGDAGAVLEEGTGGIARGYDYDNVSAAHT